ncbi:hypothetical protein AB0910_12495 [Streptomyces sp. NPDC047002]|uniref:hypothetical protein n=1 Tax=Streptomyces sp. NPDC047002 TaxID=3155475 RepID=UPI003454582D
MSNPDPVAWQLQAQADAWAADLAGQDPAPAGSDLAWQQDLIQGAYQDAATLTDQPNSR